ncbi:MAG: hypothetical protein OQL16_11505 [Gammaproteobacteria bacterium]|nr:hypothetical protein [Gammaproteobacteria bacterium]
MSTFITTVITLLCAAAIFFILKYYFRWKKIRAYADTQWDEHKSEIVKAIEAIGEETPESILLFMGSNRVTENLIITIPSSIESPWAGKSFDIRTTENMNIQLHTGSHEVNNETSMLMVPRIKLKNGKSQNVWSPSRYLSKSKPLRSLFGKLNDNEKE